MKIAHVITRLIVGGAQQLVLLMCREQLRSGHAVMLAYGPTDPHASMLEDAQRIPAQFVGKIHDLVGVARPATDLLPHAPKVNPSVTQVATAALRRFNRIAAPRTTINPQAFSHDAGLVRTLWGVADFIGRIATTPANVRQKTRRLDLIRTQTSGLL